MTASARAAVVVFSLTAVVWLAGMRGPYHFDDAITPLGDPASASVTAWASRFATTLRPLTKLTYALEASAGLDDAPAARRVTSVVIHAAAATMLVLLVLALIPALGAGRAAVLALVWSLHPVHAEAVLAIAGRSTALANALVLAALLAAVHARVRTAAALLVAAVLARETSLAAVIPVLVITRRRGMWIVLSAVVVAAAWICWTPRYQELAMFSYDELPYRSACAHQVAAVPFGLSLYIRLGALSIDHAAVPTGLAFAGGIAIYAAATTLGVLAWRRGWATVALGCAVWVAAIAPTQSVVPKIDALTERPLGLALAGLVLAVALPLVRARRAAIAVLAACILALTAATLVRGQLYASDVDLWADAAAKAPDTLRPHWNLAQAYLAAGRLDDARREFLQAGRISPYDARVQAALERMELLGRTR